MQSIIDDAALLSALSPLEHYPAAALAVSGGPDSIALMHLACRWARLTRSRLNDPRDPLALSLSAPTRLGELASSSGHIRKRIWLAERTPELRSTRGGEPQPAPPPLGETVGVNGDLGPHHSDFLSRLVVLTVDHGLRPESGAEAEFVCAQAQRLGLKCTILTWEGQKPKTGIQAAARRTRYDLLTAYCRAHNITCLVTAHTADDQAETFLMRLRRGSGLDGLAAMAIVSGQGGVALVRPLLGMSKARLMAYLRCRDLPFVRDPGNINMAFERVRLRHTMTVLASAGFARPAFVRSAARLGRARLALSHAASTFLEQNFSVTPLGQGETGSGAFHELPEDVALRVLSQVLALIGGKAEPPRMAKMERLLESLRAGKRQAALGGCLVIVAGAKLSFYREPGRISRSPLAYAAGGTCIWDGRFVLTFAHDFEGSVSAAPLGPEGWAIYRKELKEHGLALSAGRLAALTTPALWRDGGLLCAPLLKFTKAGLALENLLAKVELVPRLSHFLKLA